MASASHEGGRKASRIMPLGLAWHFSIVRPAVFIPKKGPGDLEYIF